MVGDAEKASCTEKDCTIFADEEHLKVQEKKHDMVLNLESKNIIAADQTPTPTRFLRNCEEVGLFQDLQNVNPFEETFRRAVELVKTGGLPEPNLPEDDTLHTPHVFPHLPEENVSGIYSQNCNNLKNEAKLSLQHTEDVTERNIELTAETINVETTHIEKHLETINNVKLLSPDKGSLLLNTQNTQNLDKTHDHGYTSFVDPKQNEQKSTEKQTVRENHYSYLKNKKTVEVESTTKQATNISSAKYKLQQVLLRNKHQIRSKDEKLNSPFIINPVIKITPPSFVPAISIVHAIPVVQNVQNVSILPNIDVVSCPQKKVNTENKQTAQNEKKGNDSEKRRELLERNRAAALRCREKRKMKIKKLSNSYDFVCQENSNLKKENMALRSEILQLKTLLLAHNDCSVTKAMNMGRNIPITQGHVVRVEVPTTETKEPIKHSLEPLSHDRESKISKITAPLPEIVQDITKTSVIVINNTYNNLSS